MRCYNCGDEEHVCAECQNKSRGPKGFKCGGYGHIASKCGDLGKFTLKKFTMRGNFCERSVKVSELEISN